MIRITKLGKIDHLITFEGKCWHCGLELECHKNDVTWEDGGYVLRCPTSGCNELISVNQKDESND